LIHFETRSLPAHRSARAPDGSDVRVLLRLEAGSMAHFRLEPGRVSTAIRHRSVEEIWYVVGGSGRMWRRQGERETVVDLAPGVCLTIPRATSFQFRASGVEPLTVVAATMPPWPGDDEATIVKGPWEPTVDDVP
jgi:mannose-6-phosphate isomerase-like protein (cupin superfamily)